MEKSDGLTRSNKDFLSVISTSFEEFVKSGTSRRPDKLKPLHGAIAEDLAEMLGEDFSIVAQGYGCGKEGIISGRYMDKKVDVIVYHGEEVAAGIEVKFIMQNYSQNSNNYFESMLGETANIRSEGYPLFQVVIILDRLPYYDRAGKVKKWETFTDANVKKYISLSEDKPAKYFHTPDKTLIYIVHIPECGAVQDRNSYMEHYRHTFTPVTVSGNDYVGFGSFVILNDYVSFTWKVYHTIMAQ